MKPHSIRYRLSHKGSERTLPHALCNLRVRQRPSHKHCAAISSSFKADAQQRDELQEQLQCAQAIASLWLTLCCNAVSELIKLYLLQCNFGLLNENYSEHAFTSLSALRASWSILGEKKKQKKRVARDRPQVATPGEVTRSIIPPAACAARWNLLVPLMWLGNATSRETERPHANGFHRSTQFVCVFFFFFFFFFFFGRSVANSLNRFTPVL
jgi:hypothetical protein